MHGMLATPGKRSKSTGSADLNQVMIKLDQYRRQSEELALMNELHQRMADTVDPQSIIEAFSVWLMPQVEHELVAYRHQEKGQAHVFCSCHGPERRRAIKVTERLFQQPQLIDCRKGDALDGYHVRCWQLPDHENGQLLLLRKKSQMPAEKAGLVDDGVAVLGAPLQRAVYYEKLIEQATRDTLTGLANRRVFDERIDAFLERAKRNNQSLTLASMDLDNFKKINDALGHAEGDRVLTRVAKVFADTVRKSDLLVRMGGDASESALRRTTVAAERLSSHREDGHSHLTADRVGRNRFAAGREWSGASGGRPHLDVSSAGWRGLVWPGTHRTRQQQTGSRGREGKTGDDCPCYNERALCRACWIAARAGNCAAPRGDFYPILLT